jgi:flap endonuclease-1
MTISGKRRMHGRMVTVKPEKVVLDELLSHLSVTRDQLIDIAILTGTDFHPGVKGIGAKTGLKKVKNGEFSAIWQDAYPDFDSEPIREFFRSPPVTDEYIIYANSPDISGIRRFLCDSYGFSEERINPVLERISKKGDQKTLENWF